MYPMSDPPPGWTPPGWTPPPWPPPGAAVGAPRSRPPWKLIIGIAALVVVGLGLVVAVAAPKIVHTVTGPADGANAYLRTLRDNDPAAGYQLLCDRLRTQGSEEAYATYLDRQAESTGRVVKYTVFSSHVSVGTPRGSAQFRVTTTKDTAVLVADMRKEDGEWHWCGSGPPPKVHTIGVHFP